MVFAAVLALHGVPGDAEGTDADLVYANVFRSTAWATPAFIADVYTNVGLRVVVFCQLVVHLLQKLNVLLAIA